MAQKVEIRLDQDRMVEVLTIDSMIAILDLTNAFYELSKGGLDTGNPMATFAEMAGNIKQARDFVCQFVWNGDGYMSIEDARPIVGKMSLKDLIATVQSIAGQTEEIAVPQS